ncbi:hypothetical protein KUV73_16860 [Mameliella alba]|nr:hypothetical protein [Mameliella alba]MBY6171917.1 hypothetical protein [Mameliella alba]MBY6176045.1 hypothetical protein [Mameliella alba]
MGVEGLIKGKGIFPHHAGLAALTLLACAGPAWAQGGLFTPPEGCTTYLTVQSRSCVVTNHFVCPQIDPDHKFRTDFGEAGPYFTSRIDGDGQWIESGPPEEPARTRTMRPVTDPGSVSELVETGIDSFDFTQRSTTEGVTRVTGFDRIVGEVEIDGEPLYRTEFEMTRRDVNGRVIEHVTGKEYVSATHKRFFAGFAADITDEERQTNARDRSPVEFIYPGEQGFRSTYPRHDCDLMSGLPLSEDTA